MKDHTSYLIYLKDIATEKGLNLFWVTPDMGVGTTGESTGIILASWKFCFTMRTIQTEKWVD